MNDLPYQIINPEELEINTTNSLSRLIDGIGFRYRWATEGLTENEISFRPVEGSMNTHELLIHINELVIWIDTFFGGQNDPIKANSFSELRESTLNHCLILSDRFKSLSDNELLNLTQKDGKPMNPKRYWNMINGPMADALTHIGQITSWRRIAGNPHPSGVNLFMGNKKESYFFCSPHL